MTTQSNKEYSKNNDLIDSCINQLSNSYCPYSNFRVSSVIVTTDGLNYSGVNVENSSYSLTLCAEASAIANMITDCGQTSPKIKQVIIANDTQNPCPPCGACLQRLLEFSNDDTEVILTNYDHSNVKKFNFNEMMPMQFKSNFLS
jgi:cytidine deaminase